MKTFAVAALKRADLTESVIALRRDEDQARLLAEALNLLAKTDRLDAGVLAHFADAVAPPVRPLPDADTQQL